MNEKNGCCITNAYTFSIYIYFFEKHREAGRARVGEVDLSAVIGVCPSGGGGDLDAGLGGPGEVGLDAVGGGASGERSILYQAVCNYFGHSGFAAGAVVILI